MVGDFLGDFLTETSGHPAPQRGDCVIKDLLTQLKQIYYKRITFKRLT